MQWYEYWKATRMKWHLNLEHTVKALGFMITTTWRIMPMQQLTYSLIFLLIQRTGRHSQPLPTLTSQSIKKLSVKIAIFWSGAQRKLCTLCSRDFNRLRPYVLAMISQAFTGRKGTRCGRQRVNQRSAKATSCIGSGESGGTSIA